MIVSKQGVEGEWETAVELGQGTLCVGRRKIDKIRRKMMLLILDFSGVLSVEKVLYFSSHSRFSAKLCYFSTKCLMTLSTAYNFASRKSLPTKLLGKHALSSTKIEMPGGDCTSIDFLKSEDTQQG